MPPRIFSPTPPRDASTPSPRPINLISTIPHGRGCWTPAARAGRVSVVVWLVRLRALLGTPVDPVAVLPLDSDPRFVEVCRQIREVDDALEYHLLIPRAACGRCSQGGRGAASQGRRGQGQGPAKPAPTPFTRRHAGTCTPPLGRGGREGLGQVQGADGGLVLVLHARLVLPGVTPLALEALHPIHVVLDLAADLGRPIAVIAVARLRILSLVQGTLVVGHIVYERLVGIMNALRGGVFADRAGCGLRPLCGHISPIHRRASRSTQPPQKGLTPGYP